MRGGGPAGSSLKDRRLLRCVNTHGKARGREQGGRTEINAHAGASILVKCYAELGTASSFRVKRLFGPLLCTWRALRSSWGCRISSRGEEGAPGPSGLARCAVGHTGSLTSGADGS